MSGVENKTKHHHDKNKHITLIPASFLEQMQTGLTLLSFKYCKFESMVTPVCKSVILRKALQILYFLSKHKGIAMGKEPLYKIPRFNS